MEKSDVAIVGGGPAGTAVASFLAREGFEVILLEKRPQIGIPVRCGEATGSRKDISRFIPVDETWISADINAVRLVAPNGLAVEKRLPGVGVVLDRSRFDQALADQAISCGADVRVHTEAVGLINKNGTVGGVRVRDHASGRLYTVLSKVTVGADGIEGFTGRWAGLTRHLPLSSIHSAIQYLVEGDGLPRDTIELHAGQKIAPGGYAWVFPKRRGSANIGLGVNPTMLEKGTANDLLDRFIARRFPDVKIRATIAGATSGTLPLKTMVGNSVLLVGEAAHHNNPFSGGGIMNALEGAREAATVLSDALRAKDLTAPFLKKYDTRWVKSVGQSIRKFALLREFFYSLEDKEMDRVAAVLKGITRDNEDESIDYTEIFKAVLITAFKTTPRLIWRARTLLW